METLEHWWRDVADGGGRVDVYLRFNPAGGQFEVEHRAGVKSVWREYASEVEARAAAERLRARKDGWQCLIYLSRASGQPVAAVEVA